MSRLSKLPPYLFSEIDAAKRAAQAAGRDVIDLGIGDPERPTPDLLTEAMAEAVRRPGNHRYPANAGNMSLRQTIAQWMERRHGLSVDPESQVQVLIGSKEGLAHLPLALLTDGDRVLVPDPGYPVYTQATILAGGQAVPYRLEAGLDFQPAPEVLAGLVDERTRLLFMNFPHNPTGAAGSGDLFAAALELGRAGGLAVANDAAYLEVQLDGGRGTSILASADLQRDPVIEFHSLSKMFNMTGWRIGFAVGNAKLISALARVKESMDSGVFGAVQDVAELALSPEGDRLLDEVMAVYPPRRRLICEALQKAGIDVFKTTSTFYVWARVPADGDSIAFCSRVLQELDLVITPGVGFGPGGQGWFRISLTASQENLETAAERLERL